MELAVVMYVAVGCVFSVYFTEKLIERFRKPNLPQVLNMLAFIPFWFIMVPLQVLSVWKGFDR